MHVDTWSANTWSPRGQQVSHQRWIWGIHCTQATKHVSQGSTLAFKLRADVIRSRIQGYQWTYKKDLCHSKISKRKKKSSGSKRNNKSPSSSSHTHILIQSNTWIFVGKNQRQFVWTGCNRIKPSFTNTSCTQRHLVDVKRRYFNYISTLWMKLQPIHYSYILHSSVGSVTTLMVLINL